MRHSVKILLNFTQQAQRLHIIQNSGAGIKSVHTPIGLRDSIIQAGMLIHDIQQLKLMTPANFKVIKVVSRCDFYCPCAFFHIRIAVSDNRYLAPYQRQSDSSADKMSITFIIRVDGNSHIPQHCFRAGCRNSYGLIAACDRIDELPHFARDFTLFNFKV